VNAKIQTEEQTGQVESCMQYKDLCNITIFYNCFATRREILKCSRGHQIEVMT
jgi:hypothetical protein